VTNRKSSRASAAMAENADPAANEDEAASSPPAKAFAVVFTPQEGQALIQMIDHFVRAQGLAAAGGCHVIADKINQAFDAAQKPTAPAA